MRFVIRKFGKWLALVTLLAIAIQAQAAARTLLVVGDSLSAAYGIDARAGWVTLLADRLRTHNPNYNVVNASISGDTTGNGRARLPGLLALHRPQVVIIELGGNDGLRGLALDAMRRNLSDMIAQSQTAGAKVLLVAIPLPPNYGRPYTEKFRRVYQDVARARNVPLVTSVLNGIGADPRLMQPDGIHPRAEAQPRMLDNVWPTLRRLL